MFGGLVGPAESTPPGLASPVPLTSHYTPLGVGGTSAPLMAMLALYQLWPTFPGMTFSAHTRLESVWGCREKAKAGLGLRGGGRENGD